MMKLVTKCIWCVLIVIPLAIPGQTSRNGCSVGRYLVLDPGRFSYCKNCPAGTYITGRFHQRQNCIPCSLVKDTTTEVIESKCNRTHNAVIVCKKGYHRNKTTEKCEGVCGKDTYYNISADDCLPCPAGSYMDREQHAQTSCHKLQETTLITQPPETFFGTNQYPSASDDFHMFLPGTFQNHADHAERTYENYSTEIEPMSHLAISLLGAISGLAILVGFVILFLISRWHTQSQATDEDVSCTPDEQTPMQTGLQADDSGEGQR